MMKRGCLMGRKGVPVSKREAAVSRILSKESTPKAEARRLGVTPTSVRSWVRKRRLPLGASSPPPPLPSPPSTGNSSSAPPPSPPADPLLAALEAAECTSSGAAEKSGESPPPPGALVRAASSPSSVSESFAVETVLGLVDTGVSVVVRVFSTAYKVPMDDEMRELSRLSSDERKKLAGLAPAALPYLKRWLEDFEAVGAAMFGLSAVMILADRMGLIQRKRNLSHGKSASDPEGRRSPGASRFSPPPVDPLEGASSRQAS